MRVGVAVDAKHREGLVSFLRRLLVDLEDGKIVRVALDLQALIDELEHQKPGEREIARGTGEVPGDQSSLPVSGVEGIGARLVAESVWV